MSQRSRANTIRKVFLDASDPAGFTTPTKVWRRVQKYHPSVTLKEVKSVLASLDAYTLHRHVRKPRKTRRYLSPGINKYHQMDLFQLSKRLVGPNRHAFILFSVDAFSRRMFARPLKSKDGKSVEKGIRQIFKESGVAPLNLLTDRGTEFLNARVQQLFRQYGINHFTAENQYHGSIVERSFRSLRQRIGKYMTHHKTNVFIPKLQEFVSAYNQTPHRALPTGISPNEVTPKNEFTVWKHQFAQHFRRAPGYYGKGDLSVGDVVRITKFLGAYAKSWDESFTREKFVVTHVLHTKPITYKIAALKDGEPIIGAFYREEIQPVST